jgi:hypothetical protein
MARIDRRGGIVLSPRESEEIFLEIWEALDKPSYDEIKSVCASPGEMIATLSAEEPAIYNMIYGRVTRRRHGMFR